MSLLRRSLCFVLGGHAWQGPRSIEGRLRLTCGYGCGAVTAGVQTLGQERAARDQKVRWMNLRQVRDGRRRVA